MNFAAAVRKHGRPPAVAKKTPQAVVKPLHRIPVHKPIAEKFNEVERRTQVLRKVPTGTTTTSILQDLKDQCDIPINQVVESVVQEPLDRRRFYIRYRTVELKRTNARRGFRIGDIQIPAEKADMKGFIPDLPHYMDRDDVVAILSNYGDVVSAKFRTFEETDIRCGGLEFELDLHENKRLPGHVQILNDTFTLSLKDDLKLCSYCDKYGHVHRECRKKTDDLMKKRNAQLEALYQTADAQRDADFEMEVPDSSVGGVIPKAPNRTPTLVPMQVQRSTKTTKPEQPRTNTDENPAIDNSTQPLTYPSSYEQLKENGENSTSEEELPPPKRLQMQNFVLGSPLATVPAAEPPQPKHAYYAAPAQYVEHPTTPYRAPPHLADRVPPLTDEQKERIDELTPLALEEGTTELNELNELIVQKNSYEMWKQDTIQKFKKVAKKRWRLHHADILSRLYPDEQDPQISDETEGTIYIESVKKVRADLERTPVFKENWHFLCKEGNCFQAFTFVNDYNISL